MCLAMIFVGPGSDALTQYERRSTRAKVAAVAATPGCSQAHNLGHPKSAVQLNATFQLNESLWLNRTLYHSLKRLCETA